MRGWTIALLAAAAIAACAGGERMEVRTYELAHLEKEDAEALVAPYVRTEGGGVFSAGENARAITVRESPETLEEIQRVLAEHDRAPHGVALEFAVLEAGSFDDAEEEAPGVDTLLRDVLKFEDYRTATRGVVRTGAHQEFDQNLRMPGSEEGYVINGRVGRITDREVQLRIALYPGSGPPLLQTSVTVPIGQTVVLGTAAGSGPDTATILTVRPTLLESAATD